MMTVRLWPDWLDDVWAKSADKGASGQAEGLAQHTWNVLEKLSETIHLRQDLPGSLGFPSLWHCLFWASWLHDWGKAAQGFQDALRGGSRWLDRHEIISLAFLDWIAGGLSEEECLWIAAAIASHHRDANEMKTMYSYLWLSDESQLAARIDELPEASLRGLWRWLDECPASWIEALGLAGVGIRLPTLPPEADATRAVREQGAERAAFWFKRYVRFVGSLSRQDERAKTIGTLALRGYIVSSDHMASAHTGDLPAPLTERSAALLARLRIEEKALYAHQRQCAQTTGSAVLTAPTGSGKTEAALLWASSQISDERPVPRLFYALPYQASMNAMYDRLNNSERGAFPRQVGLEHSRSTLALYRRLLDQDHDPRSAERAARWGRNLAELNYFPVRVLSPYQMLKGPFRIRGYESLLSDYFDAVFVMDEIHAYEAERLALILGTVKYLRQHFGARFFVMTATLPGLVRARLADALGEHAVIQASSELFARFRRHTLRLMEGDLTEDRWLDRVVHDANERLSVLVCCNTVKRAQQVYDQVTTRLRGTADVVLLHGRFNGRDRLLKEGLVRQATGSESTSRQPIVLVATQVVEVSLDIDLDTIYTDPAPLEALVQRFGRVNRRRLKESASVHVFNRPDDGQHVYEADLVQASLQVLAKGTDQEIDEEGISSWLDQVYQYQIAERWNHSYDRAYNDFCSGPLETLRAFDSNQQLESEFYRAFDSVEVLPASQEMEYRRMWQDEPLAASQLLVPIRWGQFRALEKEGLTREEGYLRIVEAPYSAELGLQL